MSDEDQTSADEAGDPVWGTLSTVFQGAWAPPPGARFEDLAFTVDGEGAPVIERCTLHLPEGSTFDGRRFPRGGTVSIQAGNATISEGGV